MQKFAGLTILIFIAFACKTRSDSELSDVTPATSDCYMGRDASLQGAYTISVTPKSGNDLQWLFNITDNETLTPLTFPWVANSSYSWSFGPKNAEATQSEVESRVALIHNHLGTQLKRVYEIKCMETTEQPLKLKYAAQPLEKIAAAILPQATQVTKAWPTCKPVDGKAFVRVWKAAAQVGDGMTRLERFFRGVLPESGALEALDFPVINNLGGRAYFRFEVEVKKPTSSTLASDKKALLDSLAIVSCVTEADRAQKIQ